jgi:hypothetical protein
MKLIKFTTMVFLIVFISLTYSTAQGFTNLSDCLVTTDIGKYIYDVKTARLGNAAGVVGGADHFKIDHVDSICSGEYSNINEVRVFQTREEIVNNLVSVDVQVTQHTGGDSDRWLLHELDAEFRTYYGIPGKSYGPEQINGQTILQDDVAGANYRWLSGNKVIEIKYRDSEMNKPEPLEVVKAYLAKHPSTITSFTLKELRNNANVTKWIKDEIDRRLWLCDKWNAQFQAGGVTQADLIYNLIRSMYVFLKYRQKYYSVSAEADLKLLFGYQQNKDIASIQTKLSQYKGWWSSNKAKSISLP